MKVTSNQLLALAAILPPTLAAVVNLKDARDTSPVYTIGFDGEDRNDLRTEGLSVARTCEDHDFECYSTVPSTFPNKAGFNSTSAGIITAVFPATQVASFNLKSVDVGCDAVPASGGLNWPVPCKVTLTARRAGTSGAPLVWEANYVPTTYTGAENAPAAKLLTVTLPEDWVNLSSVDFTGFTATNASVPYPGYVWLDTVKYVTH